MRRAAAPELLLLCLPCFPLTELPASASSLLVDSFHDSCLHCSPERKGHSPGGSVCNFASGCQLRGWRRGQLFPPGLPPLFLLVAFQSWFLGWAGIGSDTCLGSQSDSWLLIPFASVGRAQAGPGSASCSCPSASQLHPLANGKKVASRSLSPCVSAACCTAATAPSTCGQHGGAGSASWHHGPRLSGLGQGWLTPCLSPNRRLECQTRGAVCLCSLPGACPALRRRWSMW